MALFVLSSKDGWVNIMYTGLDAVGVDQQPQENFNEWRLLYFISFLLLVAFFVLNMFVGAYFSVLKLSILFRNLFQLTSFSLSTRRRR